MQPLHKVEDYAKQNNIKYKIQMRKDRTLVPPQIQPVISMQLTPDLFLAYMQDNINAGTILIQHVRNAQVIQALFREIKDSRKLSIENEIILMREEILNKQEQTQADESV